MRLDDSRSPDEAAACSIAAGLCRDQGALDLLVSQIEERQDGGRGHAALGLGMTGSAQGAEKLHVLLDDARHEPDVIEQTAMALGQRGWKWQPLGGLRALGTSAVAWPVRSCRVSSGWAGRAACMVSKPTWN